MSTQLSKALAQLEQATTLLGGLDPHGLPAAQLTDALTRLGAAEAQLTAARARVVTAIEADGTWAAGGAKSLGGWLRQQTGRFERESARTVRESRALRDHLPAAAAALAAGKLTPDHLTALVRHATSSPARLALLSDEAIGEDFLIAQATAMDAGRFHTLMKHWALRADPGAADRHWKDEADRETFDLARTLEGHHTSGWFGDAHGRLIETALDAAAGRRAKGDTRTRGQRRAAALIQILGATLDSGALQPGARIRPHLAITASLNTLLAMAAAQQPTTHDGAAFGLGAPAEPAGQVPESWGPVLERIDAAVDEDKLIGIEPATFEDNTPIPPALFAQLVCDSQLHRVIFGPDSEILDVGREERFFTKAQARGIIARDRHCQFPGCTAPAAGSEIHHTLYWFAHHGETAIATGILLCRYHHSYVHQRSLLIERYKSRWRFVRPNGTTFATTPITTDPIQTALC